MKPLLFEHDGHLVITTAWTVVEHGETIVLSFQWGGIGHKVLSIKFARFIDLLERTVGPLNLREYCS